MKKCSKSLVSSFAMIFIQIFAVETTIIAMGMENTDHTISTIPTEVFTITSDDTEEARKPQSEQNVRFSKKSDQRRRCRNGFKGAIVGSLLGLPFLGFIAYVTRGQEKIHMADLASNAAICHNSKNYTLEFLEPEKCSIIIPNAEDIDWDLCTRIETSTTVVENGEERVCRFEEVCDLLEDELCMNNFLIATRRYGDEPYNCIYPNPREPCANLEKIDDIDVDAYYKKGNRERITGLGVIIATTGTGCLLGFLIGLHHRF